MGAGHIGTMIAELLIASGDYEVTLIDQSLTALQAIPVRNRLRTEARSVTDSVGLTQAMRGH